MSETPTPPPEDNSPENNDTSSSAENFLQSQNLVTAWNIEQETPENEAIRQKNR